MATSCNAATTNCDVAKTNGDCGACLLHVLITTDREHVAELWAPVSVFVHALATVGASGVNAIYSPVDLFRTSLNTLSGNRMMLLWNKAEEKLFILCPPSDEEMVGMRFTDTYLTRISNGRFEFHTILPTASPLHSDIWYQYEYSGSSPKEPLMQCLCFMLKVYNTNIAWTQWQSEHPRPTHNVTGHLRQVMRQAKQLAFEGHREEHITDIEKAPLHDLALAAWIINNDKYNPLPPRPYRHLIPPPTLQRPYEGTDNLHDWTTPRPPKESSLHTWLSFPDFSGQPMRSHFTSSKILTMAAAAGMSLAWYRARQLAAASHDNKPVAVAT